MAKKKAATKKSAASKRQAGVATKKTAAKRPAVKKATTKQATKPAARKTAAAKPATKKAAPKKVPVAKAVKPVAKSKPAPPKAITPAAKSRPSPSTPPEKLARVPKRIPPMFAPCPWDLRDVKVTFSESSYTTHFHYIRTNPVNCQVKVLYAGTVNGPIDNEIRFPRDHGEADCTGSAKDWDADQLISSHHLVRIQLLLDGVAKTAPRDVMVTSVP